MNNQRSGQEKDHFGKQYWRIFAKEISYFEMEKKLTFRFSYDRKNDTKYFSYITKSLTDCPPN